VALRVGTSGWHYRDWRGAFYPEKLPTRRWLEHHAGRFGTVELNNTFYRLPPAAGFRNWKSQTPDGFLFTVKASRFLTHYRRLRDPLEPAERLLAAAGALEEKLGPVLLQLPPNLAVDVPALAGVFEAFRDRVRLVCEFRHSSWYCDAVYELLESHDAALCLADRRNRHTPLVRTASWGFVRMHEGIASPRPHYGSRALATWVDRVAGLWGTSGECFVYFNNDHGACAIRDAFEFATRAREAGLDVWRVSRESRAALPDVRDAS
jgi:uncharacterized protein YecE (DUF72 family)